MAMLVQVDTGYACAGIILDDRDICIEAAPIFKWMKGKSRASIRRWRKIKTATIVERF